MKTEKRNVQLEWLTFKAEYTLAVNYLIPHQISGSFSGRNPIIDRLLPSLLFINCLASFDEVLRQYEEANNLKGTKKYPNSLAGRIGLFTELKLLANPVEVDKIRERRNSLAHEIKEKISWSELEKGIAVIEAEIIKLGYIYGPMEYDAFGEASQMKDSKDPKALAEQDFTFGLKNKGSNDLFFTFVWKQKIMRSGE